MSKILPNSSTDASEFDGSTLTAGVPNALFDGTVLRGRTIGGNFGDGVMWYTGTSAPSSSLGNNDDFFFDSVTHKIYNKVSNAWSEIADITGDTGLTGAVGSDGATWSSGADVPANSSGNDGDFFFETDTDKVWKRAGGTWGEVADLTGATGATGSTGAAGATGAQGATGATGAQGATGAAGAAGADGLGVPAGGTTDQVLVKLSSTDNDTDWVDNTGGHDIVDESGTALDTRTKLTFKGELVEATDNGSDSSDITIDAKSLWLYAA